MSRWAILFCVPVISHHNKPNFFFSSKYCTTKPSFGSVETLWRLAELIISVGFQVGKSIFVFFFFYSKGRHRWEVVVASHVVDLPLALEAHVSKSLSDNKLQRRGGGLITGSCVSPQCGGLQLCLISNLSYLLPV